MPPLSYMTRPNYGVEGNMSSGWKAHGLSIWKWEQFKLEIQKHFASYNARLGAKAKLLRLYQKCTIPYYIKDVTNIVLEIDDFVILFFLVKLSQIRVGSI